MEKNKRQSRMKKVRKKLSIGARVERESHVARGGLVGGEVKKESDLEAANTISMHLDAKTGDRYSCNEAIGQTQWLSDDNEEDRTTIEEEGGGKQESS
jgi:hypothetical protein